MEPIIAGRDLRKSWGATLVLEHADFLLHAGDKVALVGPNGSGKSTLFRLLAGETAPDLGDLVLTPGLRSGCLPQVPNVPPETVVRDVLSAPSPEAQRIEAELAGLEAWMARPDAWDAADATARMVRYESLHVARGAARSESVIVNDPILNDLGVGEELLDQRFSSLSGGEKSKVLTARALANAKEKDVLLLDEPTNHMDVDTIETIEAFLQEIDAAVLLASHDKFLLDAIADKVIEIDRLRTLEYVGNYTDYRVQRDAIARAREAQRHRHQAELKRQLAIIEEFKSRKVYEQVLSRKLRVEQMRRETPEPPPTAPRAFRLSFRTGASGPGVGGLARRIVFPGGRGPQPRRPAQRRRTGAPRPREVHRPGLRPPRPRRADEPPRHREPGDCRGGPADVSGHGPRREPQPLLPERGGEQDRDHRAPAPRRVPRDLQGFVGRGEDGGVHGGAAEATVPRLAGGQGLGDREYVPEWRCDRASGSRDPGLPPTTAVGGGERPRGAYRGVKSGRAPRIRRRSVSCDCLRPGPGGRLPVSTLTQE